MARSGQRVQRMLKTHPEWDMRKNGKWETVYICHLPFAISHQAVFFQRPAGLQQSEPRRLGYRGRP
jgi:hypothetical protein